VVDAIVERAGEVNVVRQDQLNDAIFVDARLLGVVCYRDRGGTRP
jgi:hypothetical protein